MAVKLVELHIIPASEKCIAATGEAAATMYAVENWIVPNDEPQTILYQSFVEDFDFQIEYFCRETVHCRTVFVNKSDAGYITMAWCDSPPRGWPPLPLSNETKLQTNLHPTV